MSTTQTIEPLHGPKTERRSRFNRRQRRSLFALQRGVKAQNAEFAGRFVLNSTRAHKQAAFHRWILARSFILMLINMLGWLTYAAFTAEVICDIAALKMPALLNQGSGDDCVVDYYVTQRLFYVPD